MMMISALQRRVELEEPPFADGGFFVLGRDQAEPNQLGAAHHRRLTEVRDADLSRGDLAPKGGIAHASGVAKLPNAEAIRLWYAGAVRAAPSLGVVGMDDPISMEQRCVQRQMYRAVSDQIIFASTWNRVGDFGPV
jgi:hypothetical protein